jgi:NAD(P)-dependent dehydrogenase (short-subunit alcohol dehydrogenase family)
MQVSGSVALVTGANRGLGQAFAGNWSAAVSGTS